MTTVLLHDPQTLGGGGVWNAEGLRALLVRLHDAGRGAWRHDAEAAALMRVVSDRYAALARKYGMDPADAAAAAFEAMLNASTRTADDPWAVVTVAVRITLIAEHRANGLLTSTSRARRRQYATLHDVQRFGDDDGDRLSRNLVPYACSPVEGEVVEGVVESDTTDGCWAVEEVATLLSLLGWPSDAAGTAVEYVCARLADIGDPGAAFEALRRDKALRANFDLPHRSWIGLLRIVLGRPAARGCGVRHGVLARLLAGEDLPELLTDDVLVLAIAAASPDTGRG